MNLFESFIEAHWKYQLAVLFFALAKISGIMAAIMIFVNHFFAGILLVLYTLFILSSVVFGILNIKEANKIKIPIKRIEYEKKKTYL